VNVVNTGANAVEFVVIEVEVVFNNVEFGVKITPNV